MSASLESPTFATRPTRSGGVTALAWCVILAATALLPISFITVLMVMAGSHGTQSSLVGFVSVVIAPPVTLAAGIELLRRKAWARYYLIALFAVVLTINLYDFVRANPEPVRYTSPSGVPTTVLGTDRTMFVPMIVVSAAALAILLSQRTRADFASARASAGTSMPAAPAPSSPTAAPTATAVAEARAMMPVHTRSSSRLAALVAALLLLGLAGGTAWLTFDGVGRGETILPVKSALQRRSVLRAQEPVLFWVSIGLYASIAAGSAGLVGWGVVQARRDQRVRDWEG